MIAGETLKSLRSRLGISMREVESFSRRIAEQEGNEDFYISNAWLSQIENKGSQPSIYKLFTLSVIYRAKYTDLLLLYGVDLEKINGLQASTSLPKTHLAKLEVYDNDRTVSFPIRFDPGFVPEKTALLSRMVEIWGEVPISMIQHLDIRKGQYGYIGLRDYTLYPMIRPGSFVQIDDGDKKYKPTLSRSEYDRPVYFIELREGYACSWCELQNKILTLIPHPLSPAKIRQFKYPNDAEIIGRVTAVAMRLVDHPAMKSRRSPRLEEPH